MHHELKILPTYFEQVIQGNKPFEIRNNSDRNFQAGDTVTLNEFTGEHYTGRKTDQQITYVSGYAQQPGFVVFGMRALPQQQDDHELQKITYKPPRCCLLWHRWMNTAKIGLAVYSTCRDCGARRGVAPRNEWLDIAWASSGGRAPMGEVVLNNASPAKEGTA